MWIYVDFDRPRYTLYEGMKGPNLPFLRQIGPRQIGPPKIGPRQIRPRKIRPRQSLKNHQPTKRPIHFENTAGKVVVITFMLFGMASLQFCGESEGMWCLFLIFSMVVPPPIALLPPPLTLCPLPCLPVLPMLPVLASVTLAWLLSATLIACSDIDKAYERLSCSQINSLSISVSENVGESHPVEPLSRDQCPIPTSPVQSRCQI